MFAPTLFAGAMIGGALGSIARLVDLFPTSTIDAYVLVGMGTFFAGVFRAPMTSVFMVFEVSANYKIILPVMIANTIAYLIARRMQKIPFFELHASEEGLEMPSVEEQREGSRLRVEDAMGPARPVLGARTSVQVALELIRKDGDPYRLVKTGHGQWTWTSQAELESAAALGQAEARLEQLLSRGPAPRLYPDVALDNVLRLLADHPILPVSSRANINQLLGSVTLEDVHRAYGIEPSTGSAPSG
jgi:CIC family chloride channel protein